MHQTQTVLGARLVATPATPALSSVRVEAGAVNAAFITAVERALRRADRLRLGRLPLLLLQNAPSGYDIDAEALAPGSASRARACALWGVEETALDRAVRVNCLRCSPRDLAAPACAAVPRLEAATGLMGSRLSAIVACGWVARDAAAQHLGLLVRSDWNEIRAVRGIAFATVPHVSGRCRLNNPDGVGRNAWRIVRPLLA